MYYKNICVDDLTLKFHIIKSIDKMKTTLEREGL